MPEKLPTEVLKKTVSIYSLYPKSQKNAILLAGALIALLTPFTDTVYLPALKSVGDSLHASDASVAATVSAYLGAVGLGENYIETHNLRPLAQAFG